MSQFSCFGLADDWRLLCGDVERQFALKYVLMQNETRPDLREFETAGQIEAIGIADAGTGSVCRSYLVAKRNARINVREIRIQGRPDAIPATWLSPTTWQATIAVQPGTHALTFEAYDFQGQLIGTDTITITSTQPNLLVDHLRVDEIMYHPADPTPAEIAAGFNDADDFEFLELVNTSAVETLDLSGVEFTNGITFSFAGSALTSLPPGGRVVIVENLAACGDHGNQRVF